MCSIRFTIQNINDNRLHLIIANLIYEGMNDDLIPENSKRGIIKELKFSLAW